MIKITTTYEIVDNTNSNRSVVLAINHDGVLSIRQNDENIIVSSTMIAELSCIISREVQTHAALNPKWIVWGGGKCPVDEDVMVEVQLNNDGYTIERNKAGHFSWDVYKDNRNKNNIMIYRILS